jgi:hypothetical protein
MWSSIWTWAKGKPLLAGIIVAVLIVVLSGAVDGISARRAAGRYFDLAKGWAAAYQRDTAASKKEYEAKIKTLTDDRDTYRKKWETARGKMSAPWSPPSNAKALQERFNRIGYRGTLR